MIKKLLLITAILTASACASDTASRAELSICPDVSIPRSQSYLTQIAGYSDEFQVELTGYESYCTRNETGTRAYAVITPEFEARRLQPSDQSRVDFGFYTETVKGPPAYIGKKSYPASVVMNHGETRKIFSGRPVKVKLPPEDWQDFAILLGLDLSAAEADYNRRSFDVDFEASGSGNSRSEISGTTVIITETVAPGTTPPPQPQPAKTGCSSCGLFQ